MRLSLVPLFSLFLFRSPDFYNITHFLPASAVFFRPVLSPKNFSPFFISAKAMGYAVFWASKKR